MGITLRKEAQARINIDKSAYIGMEVEHSNDTAGEIGEANHKTIDVAGVRTFTNKQRIMEICSVRTRNLMLHQ